MRRLREVPVSASIHLGGTEIMVSELLGLEAGDVLVLDRTVNSAVELMVEGLSRFEGHLLRQGRELVFRIADPAGVVAPTELEEGHT